MVLLVLITTNILHLFIIIVVQLVVSGLLLPQIYRSVLSKVIFLDELDYFFMLVDILKSFSEIEIAGCSCFLGLHDGAHRCVEILCFCECFMRLGVAEVYCSSDLVDFR